MTMPATFQAKWPGKCSACGDWFTADTTVQYVDGVIAHVDCDTVPATRDDEDPLATTGAVCPVCKLTHPGEC